MVRGTAATARSGSPARWRCAIIGWATNDVFREASIPILLLLGAIAVLALGCGIGSDPAHHEPLAAMRITGSRVVGQEMRLELDYRQTYPVDVDVECDLKQAGEVVQVIGDGRGAGEPRRDAEVDAGGGDAGVSVLGG